MRKQSDAANLRALQRFTNIYSVSQFYKAWTRLEFGLQSLKDVRTATHSADKHNSLLQVMFNLLRKLTSVSSTINFPTECSY